MDMSWRQKTSKRLCENIATRRGDLSSWDMISHKRLDFRSMNVVEWSSPNEILDGPTSVGMSSNNDESNGVRTDVLVKVDMEAEIKLTKIWADEDMVELHIEVSDGESKFGNKVYVGHHELNEAVAGLDRFKDQVYGGIYDMRFGEFGPEFASGAFHARLHFQDRGKLFITIAAESDYFDFGKKRVASESTLYLTAEPAQLDDFIRELKAVSDGDSDNARLRALPPR
jgi:hypothetical protein